MFLVPCPLPCSFYFNEMTHSSHALLKKRQSFTKRNPYTLSDGKITYLQESYMSGICVVSKRLHHRKIFYSGYTRWISFREHQAFNKDAKRIEDILFPFIVETPL